MLKLIAVAGAAIVLGSLAYAEEKKAESTADESAVVESESPADVKSKKDSTEDPDDVDWSKIDWRKRLTRLQYHIMREAGTERPFQNKFWDYFKPGQYRCAGCGLPLFESDSKFDAHCGWPSFDKTIAKDTVTLHKDLKLGAPRTEIRCRRCQAHLGHVFDDGPTDTGLRYCMNSASMKFLNVKQLDVEKNKAPKSKAPDEKPKSEATEAPAPQTTDAQE